MERPSLFEVAIRARFAADEARLHPEDPYLNLGGEVETGRQEGYATALEYVLHRQTGYGASSGLWTRQSLVGQVA